MSFVGMPCGICIPFSWLDCSPDCWAIHDKRGNQHYVMSFICKWGGAWIKQHYILHRVGILWAGTRPYEGEKMRVDLLYRAVSYDEYRFYAPVAYILHFSDSCLFPQCICFCGPQYLPGDNFTFSPEFYFFRLHDDQKRLNLIEKKFKTI